MNSLALSLLLLATTELALADLWATTTPPANLPLFTQIQINVTHSPADALYYINTTLSAGAGNPLDVVSDVVAVPDSPAGRTTSGTVTSRVFASNCFLGLEWLVNATRNFTTLSTSPLVFKEETVVLGSQGPRVLQVVHSLDEDGDALTYVLKRNSRAANVSYTLTRVSAPVVHVRRVETPPATPMPTQSQHSVQSVRRAAAELADQLAERLKPRSPAGQTNYVFQLDSDWHVSTGGLGEKTAWLSLQGLANRGTTRLYLLYPVDWAFTYSAAMFSFYQDNHGMAFTELDSLSVALSGPLGQAAQGYIVWDEAVPMSMSVAFTAAGIHDAVVVGARQVAVAEKAGLSLIKDFRGMFTNQTDAEIIAWNYATYFEQCSHKYVMWLGGSCGDVQRPAVADFGVQQRAFFAGDLSTKPSDTVEYALANKIVGSLDPLAITVGWHSYCKDAEHYFTSLMSSHTARVHGLNTLPDLSFNYDQPVSEGFTFSNHANNSALDDDSKIYVSCVQSDGLGLGAWLKKGRGEIPYTWEVTLNDLWMQPSLLQMFYQNATANDLFVGALSGPGYMYPKAFPEEHLPTVIELAQKFMKTLDLHAFAMMDESQGTTVHGNMNLPKRVVDAYFEHMPESMGFVNGYAPSFTFARNGTRPFLSYDYYLDPLRSTDDAALDLQELAWVNTARPYFLVIHVREFSNILRVEQVLAKLSDEFVLVHTDALLKRAGARPTYVTRYEDDPQ